MVTSSEVSAAVATRARIVLWRAEGRQKKEVAALAGVSRPTVDLWLRRFEADGVAGLLDRRRGAAREQVPAADSGSDPGGDSDQPAGRDGSVALVEPGDGRVHQAHRGRVRVAPLRGEAVAGDRVEAAPARAPSRSARTRRSRRRWPTSSGSTSTRPAARWCSRSTRRRRSRRWTGPSRCCRSRSTRPRSAPTTTSGTAPRTCSPR